VNVVEKGIICRRQRLREIDEIGEEGMKEFEE
jgi:hypothetical protein